MNQFRTSEEDRPTFEETYPRYEFAPLVTIALALGGWLASLKRDRVKRAPRAEARTPETSGPAAPAT
jgi:hypothetical protein